MPQILIIADDLTGAADTGAPFAEAGWLTLILLDPDARTPECDVLVVSTQSRGMRREEATNRVRRAVHHSLSEDKGEAEPPHVYKKIDSTLRGHPGAELAAVMDALGLEQALVAAAFPAQGRTTVDGRQLVDGIPVEHTPFGDEALCSDLPALFQARGLIDLNRVRRGPAAVCQALESYGPGVIVADAQTDADLRAIAGAGLRCGVRLWCGSAGLAQALADVLPRPDQDRPDATMRAELSTFIDHIPSRPPGSVLVVAGSRHRRTARQVEVALGWGATMVQADPDAAEGTTMRASSRLADGQHVILAPAASALGEQAVAGALAEIARRLVATGCVGGLVLTGGDIAEAVCAALGASALWLRGETQPGIAWGFLLGGLLPGLPVVTKAGGFGTDEALALAIRRLEDWKAGREEG